MKKIVSIIAVLFLVGSMAKAIDAGSLDTATMAKFGANWFVGISYKDFATVSTTNTAITFTNVLPIAKNETIEFRGYVLDRPFMSTTAHTNGGIVGNLDVFTNSIALTVTSSNGTSILASTEIDSESTYVSSSLPYTTTTLTYLSAATGVIVAGTNCVTTVVTNTVILPVITAGVNKSYTVTDYVNVTLTPNAWQALNKRTKGYFRLFFRRYTDGNN